PQRRGGAGGIDADVDSVVVKTWSSVRGSAHVAHLCRIRRAPAARASQHVSQLYLTCWAPAARASQHVAPQEDLPCSARQRIPASMNSSISPSNTEEGLPSW